MINDRRRRKTRIINFTFKSIDPGTNSAEENEYDGLEFIFGGYPIELAAGGGTE